MGRRALPRDSPRHMRNLGEDPRGSERVPGLQRALREESQRAGLGAGLAPGGNRSSRKREEGFVEIRPTRQGAGARGPGANSDASHVPGALHVRLVMCTFNSAHPPTKTVGPKAAETPVRDLGGEHWPLLYKPCRGKGTCLTVPLFPQVL